MSSKHGGAGRGQGRKPIPRAPEEQVLSISITLPESDIVFLQTLNPKNLSAAIRQLIAQARSQL